AQAASTLAQTTVTEPSGDRVTRLQLEHFVVAYEAVSMIRKRFLIATHGMDDQDKAETLRKQANKKMKAAILAQMTLGDYVRIGTAVNSSQALHARFMKIRAKTSKPPAAASR